MKFKTYTGQKPGDGWKIVNIVVEDGKWALSLPHHPPRGQARRGQHGGSLGRTTAPTHPGRDAIHPCTRCHL